MTTTTGLTGGRSLPASFHHKRLMLFLAGLVAVSLLPISCPGATSRPAKPAGNPEISTPVRGEVIVVEDGVGRMQILTAAKEASADAKSKTPAVTPEQELQGYIRRMSGAELEIVVAATNSTGLYLGKASDFPWLKMEDEVRALGTEGFIIRSDGANLFLLALEDKGVPHAVFTFLQGLGCRWFFPGDVWEVVPDRKTIRGAWNEKQSPSYNIQRHLFYGFGSYSKNSADKQKWDRHNRMGSSMPVSIGHAGHGLSKEDFERNPDLFAMRKGQRVFGSKPCYSHPEYIQRAVSNVLRRAAAGSKMISMTPADGLGYCECPLCHQWAKGGEVYWDKSAQYAKRPDGVLVCITSESLFNCINEAARALRAKYPEALIGTYAYSSYSHPPSFPIESNVFIQTTTAYRRTPTSLEEQLQMFKTMGVQSGIRGYWAVYQWDWDYPTIKGELSLPQLVNNIRFYHLNGVRSLNTEMSCNWAPRGLGYYLGARLLWNVNEDPQALIADFYEKAFGPAAGPMENYYARWLGKYVRVSEHQAEPVQPVNPPDGDKKPGLLEKVMDELGTNDDEPEGFSRESLRAACRDLDEAARLVKDMPEYLARVNHLRLYAHYLTLRIRLDEIPFKSAAAAVENVKETLTGTGGDRRDAIIEAIKAETVFGARIMNSNMIHTRPLIGKAFHRRFKKYGDLLKGLPEWPEVPNEGWNKGFRVTRTDMPTDEELETLWAADKEFLKF